MEEDDKGRPPPQPVEGGSASDAAGVAGRGHARAGHSRHPSASAAESAARRDLGIAGRRRLVPVPVAVAIPVAAVPRRLEGVMLMTTPFGAAST